MSGGDYSLFGQWKSVQENEELFNVSTPASGVTTPYDTGSTFSLNALTTAGACAAGALIGGAAFGLMQYCKSRSSSKQSLNRQETTDPVRAESGLTEKTYIDLGTTDFAKFDEEITPFVGQSLSDCSFNANEQRDTTLDNNSLLADINNNKEDDNYVSLV
nr:TPA_asm: hypothetical protein [Schistorhabdovirus]